MTDKMDNYEAFLKYQEAVKKRFDEILNQFQESEYSFEKANLSQLLMLMKANPRLEWFNILTLNDAVVDFSKSSYLALPLEEWDYLMSDPNFLSEDWKNQIAVDLFVPSIRFFDNSAAFCWETMPFYFAPQSVWNDSEYDSPLQDAMELFEFEENQRVLSPGWQKKLIHDFLLNQRFFYAAIPETKEFLEKCLLYTYKTELQWHEDVELPQLPPCEDSLLLFKNLHFVITSFPQALIMIMKRLKCACLDIHQRMDIKRRPVFSGFQKLQDLQKGKTG